MRGINLDKPVTFLHSSLRFFSKHEFHVTRISKSNVLLLVFDGILRFTEDNVNYEIHPGEYHIQKKFSHQTAVFPSDSPKYLYVHFDAEWTESDPDLPFSGTFDYAKTKHIIEELDRLSHSNSLLTEKSARFFELLLLLQPKASANGIAYEIAEFIENADLGKISLDLICQEFHFSKNHIINIFKKKYGITPVKHINNLKLTRTRQLLEASSDNLENIARQSGFNDYSHFYKLFIRENNISPELWRKKKHTEPLL